MSRLNGYRKERRIKNKWKLLYRKTVWLELLYTDFPLSNLFPGAMVMLPLLFGNPRSTASVWCLYVGGDTVAHQQLESFNGKSVMLMISSSL